MPSGVALFGTTRSFLDLSSLMPIKCPTPQKKELLVLNPDQVRHRYYVGTTTTLSRWRHEFESR